MKCYHHFEVTIGHMTLALTRVESEFQHHSKRPQTSKKLLCMTKTGLTIVMKQVCFGIFRFSKKL